MTQNPIQISNINEINIIKDIVTCKYCNYILDDPIMCKKCHVKFCATTCAQQLTSCPQCNENNPFVKVLDQDLLNGIFDKIQFNCPYKDSGCKEILGYSNLKSHIEKCRLCLQCKEDKQNDHNELKCLQTQNRIILNYVTKIFSDVEKYQKYISEYNSSTDKLSQIINNCDFKEEIDSELTRLNIVYNENENSMLQEAIVKQTKSIKVKNVQKLNLSNVLANKIDDKSKSLLEKFINLNKLILTDVSLKNLDNFPYMKNLNYLSVTGGQIESGFDNLNKNTSLKYLIMSDNNIKNFEELEKLKLNNLENLYIDGNPIVNTYEAKFFLKWTDTNFPNLIQFKHSKNEYYKCDSDKFKGKKLDSQTNEPDKKKRFN